MKRIYGLLLLGLMSTGNLQIKAQEDETAVMEEQSPVRLNLKKVRYPIPLDSLIGVHFYSTTKELPIKETQDDGWFFDNSNTFDKGEKVLAPIKIKNDNIYVLGEIVDKTERGKYIVYLGPLKETTYFPQELGKWTNE